MVKPIYFNGIAQFSGFACGDKVNLCKSLMSTLTVMNFDMQIQAGVANSKLS